MKKNERMCELCERKSKTKLYYEDQLVWVVDCDTCHTPMGALKRHTLEPTMAEAESLERALNMVGSQVLGDGRFRIDRNMRKIKNHLHHHLRPL